MLSVTHLIEPVIAFGLLTWLIVWGGWRWKEAIGKDSPKRRRHGQFVYIWMISGWITGVVWGLLLGVWGLLVMNSHNPIANSMALMAWMGLLLGWVVGMIHGAIVVFVESKRKPSEDLTATTTDNPS
jgi:heme/copper-type cytochrome/quinol oxidase subunit 2